MTFPPVLFKNLGDQVFRLKAEGYETSRKARIKPFKTFSVSTSLLLHQPTQMPEVLCGPAWFVPNSLQPSA
jgi:hypothetical protein